MIIDDYIKLTLISGGKYGLGELVGNKRCYANGGKMVVEDSPTTLLYYLENKYKIIRYHGYLENSSIILLDENENVLKEISSNEVIQDFEFVVPDECKSIYLSVASDYEDSYYLQLFSSGYYNVTGCVDNWDSLEVVLSRDKTSGVISEVSFEFEFVLSAREYLRQIFNETGLYSNVTFSIHKRADKSNDYTLVKELQLDFGTYKLTSDRVRISSANNTLAETINSKGKTEYEIPVSEICEEKKWNFSRINVLNNAMYQMADFSLDRKVSGYIAPTIITTSVELAPGQEDIDFVTQNLSFPGSSNYFPSYLLKSVSSDKFITINVRLKANISCSYQGSQVVTKLQLSTYSLLGAIERDEYLPSITNVKNGVVTHTFILDIQKEFIISPGREFNLNFYFANEVTNPTFKVYQEEFTIYYKSEVEKKPISVINPISLIQRYVDEMTGVKGLYHASILWNENNYNTMIAAADSIRQIGGAKIYGKPNDFFDWMRVLGYEYEITDNKLIFKPRDEFFTRSIAMTMREDEIADLIEEADTEYAYTTVEIGYDKQDYDKLNGRLEPNGKFTFTTGYESKEDNKLSLISPYRADSIGIEYLSQESSKKTKDEDSDNDIFFMALVENDTEFTEYKDVVYKDRAFGLELFNAVFSPYYLVMRNYSLIGINTNSLKFNSTDMSRTAEIYANGVKVNPYSSFEIPEKLFEPIIYNFATGNHKDMPSYKNGIVQVNWQGEILSGYIKEIRKNYAQESEVTWELHAIKSFEEKSFSVTPTNVDLVSNKAVFTIKGNTEWSASYDSWMTLSPSSGNSNADVLVKTNTYTGRADRVGYIDWNPKGVQSVRSRVFQSGKAEFVDILSGIHASAGETITINGFSNSSKLTFTLGDGNLDISIPSYIVNGKTIQNGSLIDGDPGNNSSYEYTINIQIPDIMTSEYREIIVTDASGNRVTCNLSVEGVERLTFKIGAKEYEYEDGMMWDGWVESQYNTDGFSIQEAELDGGYYFLIFDGRERYVYDAETQEFVFVGDYIKPISYKLMLL